MKKFIFILSILISLAPSVYAKFSDVESGAWYSGYAERAAGEGWFSGFDDGSFRPEKPLTRAECAKVIYSLKYNNILPAVSAENYPDADEGAWYAVYARLNRAEDLILCPDGLFRPNDNMTREEAVTAVMRLSDSLYGSREYTDDELHATEIFPDFQLVDQEYAEYIARAVSDGLMTGIDGYLEPKGPITRAQFAKLIVTSYRPEWQTGSILPEDGSIVWSDTRIYSELMYLPASMGYVDFSQYKLAFDYYGADGARLLNSGWLTEKTYLPPGLYRIVIAKTDNSPIVPSEGAAFGVEYNVTTFSGTDVKKIAHRGLSLEAPENTIESLRAAAWAGFKYSECDVRWTADGVPVLLHDETIDRTSNGSGRLSEMTFAEVRQYDFGSWKCECCAGARIPSFEEYIAECSILGIRPYVEIYDSESFTAERALGLIETVRKYGMENRVTWISNWISSLQRIKQVDPTAALRLLFVTIDMDVQYMKQLISIKTETNEVGIDVDMNMLDAETINRIRAAGFSVECWNAGDGSAYIDGVTGLTCDKP